MAERRMFAKTIIDSDAFLDMPLSTQALYFHLSMRADDEGFINNPKKIQRMIGASEDDLKVLIAKSFVIPFESGIVVIKHWKIHNYIRADRIIPTKYTEEKGALFTKENGAYTISADICPSNDRHLSVTCQTDGCQMSDTCPSNVSIGKDSIGKDSIDKDIKEKIYKKKSGVFVPPTLEEVKAYCQERNNNVDAETFIDFYESKGWMVGKNKMKDWKAAVRTWERNNGRKNANEGKNRQAKIEYTEEELQRFLDSV
jgi:hypothetical protein